MGFFDFLFGNSSSQSYGRYSVKPETQRRIKDEWTNIDVLLSQKSPSQLRQALISADKCLDNALRDIYEGNSMGDRLKLAKDRFDWDQYQKIWDAHKVRNNLVHEAGFNPPHFMITDAVSTLRGALIKLGVRV